LLSASDRTIALDTAFEGVAQALAAAPDEESAHFSKAAKIALAAAIAQTGRARAFESEGAIGARLRAELEVVRDAQDTKELDFSIYPGDIKCVVFLFWSVKWLADPNPLEAFADHSSR